MASSGSAVDAFFDHSRGRKPVRKASTPPEPDHISLDSEDDDENDAVGRKHFKKSKKRKTTISRGISSSSSDSEIDDGPIDSRYSFENMIIKPRSSNSHREDTLPPPLDLNLGAGGSNKRPRLEGPTTPSSDSRPILTSRKPAPKQPCPYCSKLLEAHEMPPHVDAHVNGTMDDLQADWFEDEEFAEIEAPPPAKKQPNLQRRAQEHDKLVQDLGIRKLPGKQSASKQAAIVLDDDDDDDVIEDTELATAVQKSSRRPVTGHLPVVGPASRGLAPVFTRTAAAAVAGPYKSTSTASMTKSKPTTTASSKASTSTATPKAGPSKSRSRSNNVAIEIDDDEDEYDTSYPNNTPPHTGFLDKMTEDHRNAYIDLAGLGEDEPEEWRETIEKQSRAPATTTTRGGKSGGKVFNRGMKSFRRGRGAASRGGRSFKRGRGRGR